MIEYDFKCSECGKRFTIKFLNFITDKDVVFCPDCYSLKVQRVYVPTLVIYKTDGFYTTDNKKE